MTKPVSFTTGDVTRLVKALRRAGEQIASVEIDPSGKIVARFGAAGAEEPKPANPWDEVLTDGQEERPAAQRH
jgi:hypothetical protein